MPTSYLGSTEAGTMPGVLRTQASYLETAGDRCAVLLNSKSCPTGGRHILRYHYSSNKGNVLSLFPSALYFHFISQLLKNLGTGVHIYWKLSNSHTQVRYQEGKFLELCSLCLQVFSTTVRNYFMKYCISVFKSIDSGASLCFQ